MRRHRMRITYCSLAAAAAAVTLLAAPALVAQAPPAPPKPAPEVQKLAYFAGRWNETADMKASPMGPGGKMTVASSCEWFPGPHRSEEHTSELQSLTNLVCRLLL